MKKIQKLVTTYFCGNDDCIHVCEIEARKCAEMTHEDSIKYVHYVKITRHYLNSRISMKELSKIYGHSSKEYSNRRIRLCVEEVCRKRGVDDVPRISRIPYDMSKWNRYLNEYEKYLENTIKYYKQTILGE